MGNVVARSWETKTSSPERVATAFAQAFGEVRNATAATVFVSGSLAEELEAVARAFTGLRARIPIVIASGAGVLTERGELEEQSAAAGVIWSGGRAELQELKPDENGDVSESLVHLLGDRTSRTSPAVLLFIRPEGFSPEALGPKGEIRGTRHVFGAGTVGNTGAAGISPDGTFFLGSVAMILRGMPPPIVGTAYSSRLLGPLRPITSCRGAMLLEIDGQPALDVLATHGERLADRPLLFAVLAEEAGGAEETGRPDLVIRGIQGIDPDRRGLVITDEIREGMRIAFAIRDAHAAREDFEAMTRELQRDIAGAAPRFGLFFNCGGRGSGLYGTHDVDTKLLRARFPNMPFAGMASSFELAPFGNHPTMQLYTGVVALFTSPS